MVTKIHTSYSAIATHTLLKSYRQGQLYTGHDLLGREGGGGALSLVLA